MRGNCRALMNPAREHSENYPRNTRMFRHPPSSAIIGHHRVMTGNLLLRKTSTESSRRSDETRSQQQHAGWLWYFLSLWRSGRSAKLDYNVAEC